MSIDTELTSRRYQPTDVDDIWEDTQEAQELQVATKSWELQHDLIKKHSQRFNIAPNEPGFQDAMIRRSFVDLFVRANNLGKGSAKRDNSVQSNFRQDLIEACAARHPDPKLPSLWCPVEARWIDFPSAVIAAHVFPFKHGEAKMTAIFGQASEGSEMNTIMNGMMMSVHAEERFDKGMLVLVPDLKDDASPTQVRQWQKLEAKPYKLRVMDFKAPLMNMRIQTDQPATWVSLNNRRVEFRSNHRPRARYLYFAYLVGLLYKTHSIPKEKRYDDQLGKTYWGSGDRYMQRAMIRGFIEEVGHEFEALLDGGEGDANEGEDGTVPDVTALEIANEQVYDSVRQRDGDDVVEDEEDDDEDDENDEDQ